MKYFTVRGEDRCLNAATRSVLCGSFITLSDGVTHYRLSGPQCGELVVLVGGLTVPLFYWDQVTQYLHRAGRRTLAYSSYGRGYSERVKHTYNEHLFVRQLTELVQTLGLNGQHHVVAASMGALTAMQYVSENAACVASLTLAGPAGLAPRPQALRWLMSSDYLARFVARHLGRGWLKRHETNDLGDRTRAPELAAMLRDAYRYEGSLHAIFDTLQNFRLFDRAPLYRAVGELHLPILLVWGQHDRVTSIDKLGVAQTLLKPQQCHVKGCGHMVPFERPQALVEHITSFIGRPRKRNAL
ncbi:MULTISPECIES: alpha/beta fold hydrolase [unclassified Pseudomonas]|uniref:alpha/beta fold hydrolase n=1 Tax=unclassified Pseudomonas TaxID=196821 RepID=UPI000C2FDCFE|nr:MULTISPECIES: alpha/beta hydrolase [unclassified Pseudomonas]MCU1739291.1 alpha/beta hydrolase [Pseudomonas sp. 20S_6.2_Bac1]